MGFRCDIYHKLTIFALNFTWVLCLVLLKPVETALMPWLHGNDSVRRPAIFWHLQAYLTNITNAIQLWEGWVVFVPNESHLTPKITKYSRYMSCKNFPACSLNLSAFTSNFRSVSLVLQLLRLNPCVIQLHFQRKRVELSPTPLWPIDTITNLVIILKIVSKCALISLDSYDMP